VQLIDLLHKMGELEKLRAAREQMSKIFPLTEGKILIEERLI